MNEELIEITTEEIIEAVAEEVVDNVADIELTEPTTIETYEDETAVEIETFEEIEIEVEESIGWVGGDSSRHYSLYGRNEPDQHSISAITGLSKELNEIKRLKTLYSDKHGVANYYAWDKDDYGAGYFVSLTDGANSVDCCGGTDIFGVTVDDAGFVGCQDATIPRNDTHALVVTSGLVDVMCELDVEVGDCVTSNAYGKAKKSNSRHGYRVVAVEPKNGVRYATIALGIQADVTDMIGADIEAVNSRLETDEARITSAINVANAAHNKAMEASEASTVSEETVKQALESILDAERNIERNIEDFEESINASSALATQTKAIAESAASFSYEATSRANDAWAKADTVSADMRSLCAKIDTYSVGEYSQAYGLTLWQAQSILQSGMVYAPTMLHVETYEYTNTYETVESFSDVTSKDVNKVYYDRPSYWYYSLGRWTSAATMPEYKRDFVPGYLYQWRYIDAMQQYGWVTIDKNYNPTDEANTSAQAVYFSSEEIPMNEEDSFGYWYANADQIKDKDGNVGTYEPYTLYKWEDGRWLAVATLLGNASNRMTSEIYQTTNQIIMGVTDPRGCIAAIDTRVTDTNAEVQSLTAWKNGGDTNSAIIRQETDENGSKIIIATLNQDGDEVTESAKLELNVAKDASGNPTSALSIGADYINFTADDYKVIAKNIGLEGYVTIEGIGEEGKTTIHGSNITTGVIKSKNDNMKIDLDKGEIDSPNFKIDDTGKVTITSSGGNYQTSIEDGRISVKNSNGDPIGSVIGWNSAGTDAIALAAADDASEVAIGYVDTFNNGQSGLRALYRMSPKSDNYQMDDIKFSHLMFGNIYTQDSIAVYGNVVCNNNILSLHTDEKIYNKNSVDDEKYEKFLDALNPTSFNDGQSGAFHIGYTAEDVGSALASSGLTADNFAGYKESSTGDPYAIDYREFVALLHYKIKKLEERIEVLESKLADTTE